MPYSPVAIPGFGGLVLYPDPQEVGTQNAIDLLNVDLDKRGRIRSRDGYTNFFFGDASATDRQETVAPFYLNDGTAQLLAASASGSYYRAYDTTGAGIDQQNVGTSDDIFNADFTRFGGPGAEVAYGTSTSTNPNGVPVANTVYKWDGSNWAGATGCRLGGAGKYPFMLEVKADENRLVGVFEDDNASRIGFSDVGTPETWGANSYDILTPGDGERITALVAWRELVFAFKETKYFVFGVTSINPANGNPIFNKRPVSTGVGAVGRECAVATPNGVYFMSRRGIYKTTGGDPVLVSRDIDPVFRGGASPFFLGGVLNQEEISKCQLAWHDERLYFAYPSGAATANDRVLVFDPEANQWLLWNIPANGMCSFRIEDKEEFFFSYSSGDNKIGRFSDAYTDDDGTAISWRYQSGFYELGKPGQDVYTRYTRLWGSGSPTVSVFTDFGTTDANAAAVILGTAPATVEGYHQKAYKGKLFSHKLSGTAAAIVSNLQHDVAWARS